MDLCSGPGLCWYGIFSLAALSRKHRSRDVGLIRGTGFIEQVSKESLLRPTLLLLSVLYNHCKA